MPPGSKKRKANKKKHKETNPNPNPNPNPDAPPPPTTLPPLHHQENGHESHASMEEEGEEETFVSPRLEPDATADLHLRNGTGPGVAESDLILVYEGLKEKSGVDAAEESLYVAESGKDAVGSVDTEVEEDSAQYFEVQGENPEVSVQPVDSCASHEKEVKIVPWLDEESLRKDFETTRHESLGDVVLENSQTVEQFSPETGNHKVLVKEVDTLDVEYEAKETDLDKLTDEKYTPIVNYTLVDEERIVGVTENREDLVQEIVTIGNEGKVKELPHVDKGFKVTELDKLSEEKYTLAEHPTLVTKEMNKNNEATSENLNKILVGIVDTSSSEKEVKVLDPQKEAGELSEIAPRNEVVRGPLVVRRTTLWNCCGLLDVLTGSQR
ncbi:uncharacterized protein M6B38_405440 [Iris pallida]|uniref:Uncharacterized protein n=1 Tax=Iris pallida TaxID=29817 RepID=A0AAX6FQ39_IRIPA|nr:uncharacterized protein M6B38_405440 [Iris pallida]